MVVKGKNSFAFQLNSYSQWRCNHKYCCHIVTAFKSDWSGLWSTTMYTSTSGKNLLIMIRDNCDLVWGTPPQEACPGLLWLWISNFMSVWTDQWVYLTAQNLIIALAQTNSHISFLCFIFRCWKANRNLISNYMTKMGGQANYSFSDPWTTIKKYNSKDKQLRFSYT